MKKQLLALAAAALAPLCHAQSSVTVYGTIDTGVAFVNNGAAGPSNSIILTSGVLSASRLGFIGVEDLGGGMKAKFQIEAGFDADTGALKTYSGNPSTATPAAPGGAPVAGLFNRRSYVGLEGSFGSIAFGRDYTPTFYASLETDVMALGLYGNVQETVLLSGTGSDRFGRASNAIFYVSPNLSGFQGRAMLSLGSESAGGPGAAPSDANRMWAVQGRYTTGAFLVSGAYQEIKLPQVAGSPAAFNGAAATRKDLVLGTKYTFGDYAVAGGYFQARQPVPNTDTRDVWLGASAKVGLGSVLANVQRLRQDSPSGTAASGNVLGVSYVHPLSKRTTLYASYGQLSNSPTAAFAIVGSDPSVAPGAAGATVRALAFGVRHNF